MVNTDSLWYFGDSPEAEPEELESPAKCGSISIGDKYMIVTREGDEIGSGTTAYILYRGDDWSVSALVDEISKRRHEVPPGATLRATGDRSYLIRV